MPPDSSLEIQRLNLLAWRGRRRMTTTITTTGFPDRGGIGDVGSRWDTSWLVIASVLGVLILFFCVTLLVRRSKVAACWFKLFSFILLHLCDYGSNVATMVVIGMTERYWNLFLLGTVHLIVGGICAYTATNCEWPDWAGRQCCKVLIIVVVMGFMQLVQVKLAVDDFQQQRRLLRAPADNELVIPDSMPARFYIKTMDGLLEGAAFAFVSMYVLLKYRWAIFGDNGINLEPYQVHILWCSAFTSFAAMGFALTELDYRTSASVQRKMNTSSKYVHIVFRASEIAWRLLTGLILCSCMRVMTHWWLAFIGIGMDYFLGVVLLLCMGGHDPIREAVWAVGVVMLLANVMQFVDTPGLSLQAHRISRILVPFRSFEFVGILVFLWFVLAEMPVVSSETGEDSEDRQGMTMRDFMWNEQPLWLFTWGVATVLYFILLVGYASQMQKDEDLHMAVAYGKIEALRRLIMESDLVLDINRYGPDGRTPLHLACIRGQVDCLKLLLDQRADVKARTSDNKHQTVLHLAVMNKNPEGTRHLCHICSSDEEFLNTQNTDGDTALHVAARRQNINALKCLLRIPTVDFKLRNKHGQTAADCAPSDKFGFDRESSECVIAEIFRRAEAGIRPSVQEFECELSRSGRSAPDMAAIAASDAEDSIEQGNSKANSTEVASDLVPLVPVAREVEEAFLKRQQSGFSDNSRINVTSPVTNCGISSFLLSAGKGSVSRAFLNFIKEDEDLYAGAETQHIKASFEDFTEVRRIGEGAFGKVLLVRRRETGEMLAMKLMDKAKFRAQKITSKAHSEQYILKTTRFPFIVALQYAFQGSNFWALVMEYCPNGDLQDLLVKKGNPGLRLFDCARLGGEVLLALEHLHRIQVIFRDLKLENVVLCPKFRAKLTDFGLAKKLYTTTDARTMCGSYGYAAPEIMSNQVRYSYSVDLYSFGVMMYMLLSGGDQAPNNPQQRLPPMRHSSLKRRIRDIGTNPPGDWANRSTGAVTLLEALTSEDARQRKTASEMKRDPFFPAQLNHTVDYLLEHVDKSYQDMFTTKTKAASPSASTASS